MGGKRSRKRKHVHLFIAVLILLGPLACAFDQMMSTKMVDVSGEEARAHLILGRKFFAEGDFKNALKENEQVISLAGRNTPIDEALFTIALIHAHFENPEKDDGKSVVILRKLIRDYPAGLLAQKAKVVLELIQDNGNLNRQVERANRVIGERQEANADIKAKTAEQAKIITGLTQENERLTRIIEGLNTIVDKLKKVDIDVDQKKREKVK